MSLASFLRDLALFPLVLVVVVASLVSLASSLTDLALFPLVLVVALALLRASLPSLQYTYASHPQYSYALFYLSAPSPSITQADYVLLRQASPHTLQMYIYFMFTGSYLI